MSNVPDELRYTKDHEWVRRNDDGTVTVGITDFAVTELCSGNEGDLVYCDLPEPGRALEAGETFGEIESVKAVADLNTPVAGSVLEVNVAIEEHLEILSRDPFNEGWMMRMTPRTKSLDADGLLDLAAYEALLAAEEH